MSDIDINDLYARIYKMFADLGIGTYGDGGFPVQVILVNKQTHQKMQFIPVPKDGFYDDRTQVGVDKDRYAMERHYTNLRIAQDSFDTALRIWQASEEWLKKHPK